MPATALVEELDGDAELGESRPALMAKAVLFVLAVPESAVRVFAPAELMLRLVKWATPLPSVVCVMVPPSERPRQFSVRVTLTLVARACPGNWPARPLRPG